MKRAFFSGMLCCACFLLKAQAPATGTPGLWQPGHFLWFTGHWSRSGNKQTFIITRPAKSPTGATSAPGGATTPPNGDPTNPSAGGTITPNPDGSLNLSNSSVDAWNKKMDQAANSAQQYLRDLRDPGDNLDPTTHQLNQLLQSDAQQQIDEIKSYKIDPHQDMLASGTKPSAPAPTVSDLVSQGCKNVKADYDLVMNYYNTRIKGHSADLDNPPPPQQEYDCYTCDSSLRKIYDTTVQRYIDNFSHPEDSMIRKGLRILHEFALANITPETGSSQELSDLFRKSKSDPSKTGPCAFLDLTAFSEAVLGIAHHVYLRGEKLVEANRNNYKAIKAIARTYMRIAREWALISGNSAVSDEIPTIADITGQAADHYLNELKQNDWRQIGNLTGIVDILREYQLMGGGDSRAQDYYGRLLRIWNGFQLTVNMDIKLGDGPSYKLVHVRGQCHIIPSFRLMNLSMNFCNLGHDTIILSGFDANPPGTGTWLHYGNAVTADGVGDMTQFFEDMNAKKKLADNGEAAQAQADLQARSAQLQAQMQALQAQMGNSQSGATSGANFEKMMELQKNLVAQLSTPTLGKLLWLDFLLQVQNNQNVLVHNVFDAKKINPEEAPAIIYGFYTIDIKNDGNGKSKSKSTGAPTTPKK